MNQQQLLVELCRRVERLEDERLEDEKRQKRTYNQYQAAARLNESPNTFRKRQRAGQGPKGFLDGRVWKFTEESIQDYPSARSA
jgi:hypothetical protein